MLAFFPFLLFPSSFPTTTSTILSYLISVGCGAKFAPQVSPAEQLWIVVVGHCEFVWESTGRKAHSGALLRTCRPTRPAGSDNLSHTQRQSFPTQTRAAVWVGSRFAPNEFMTLRALALLRSHNNAFHCIAQRFKRALRTRVT